MRSISGTSRSTSRFFFCRGVVAAFLAALSGVGTNCLALGSPAFESSSFRSTADPAGQLLASSGLENTVSAAHDYAEWLSPAPVLRDDVLGTSSAPPVRKPGVAFLLSAILPGAGQLYNGNKRGYAFLGAEAAFWFARLSYNDAGDRKVSEYKSYADRHWDYPLYSDSQGLDGCPIDTESDSLVVHYAESDRDQYYEEIGKNEAYQCGWDDFRDYYDEGGDGRSPNRADYLAQREKANDLQNNANMALALMVLNRIVAGVDAFRVARSRQNEARSGIRFESRFEGSVQRPRAVFQFVKEIP